MIGIKLDKLPKILRETRNPRAALRDLHKHRFSAFWLRSKCSICSYQLNIWYEDHASSSILIWFLPGETRSVACNAGFTGWPRIAVPRGSAHFPNNLYNAGLKESPKVQNQLQILDKFPIWDKSQSSQISTSTSTFSLSIVHAIELQKESISSCQMPAAISHWTHRFSSDHRS